MVSVNFAYELKEQKKSGNYAIDLSKATTETINFRFDENLGSDVAQCKAAFVPLTWMIHSINREKFWFLSMD